MMISNQTRRKFLQTAAGGTAGTSLLALSSQLLPAQPPGTPMIRIFGIPSSGAVINYMRLRPSKTRPAAFMASESNKVF